MSSRKYYHNVTQRKYNEIDVIDLIEHMNYGDIILWSMVGNACVFELTEDELSQLKARVDMYYTSRDSDDG